MKNKLTILLLFSFFSADAQSSFLKNQINKKFFTQKGIEIEYTLFPNNSINIQNVTYENQWESAGLNLSYILRFNILELDEDQAFSISIAPALGLSYGLNHSNAQSTPVTRDVDGVGNFNFPIEFNYHIGKGATKNSTYKYGLTFTIGKDFRLNPIITWSDFSEYEIGLKKYYDEYFIKIGLTREKKRIHEIYMRSVLFRKTFDYFSGLGQYRSSGNFSIGFRFNRKK